MEATAEHDFNASAEDEISFKRGQLLKILNKDEDPHWFKAECDGIEGFVPSNYIRMHDHAWYLGKITRLDAEVLLRKQGTLNGEFLVRQCESAPGTFAISVRFDERIQHFKVLRDHKGRYYLWTAKFASLNQLVDYHRTSSVSCTHQIILKDMETETHFVRALFDFAARERGELAFRRGEIIALRRKQDENWWEGELNNRRGVFPANYVCPLNRHT
ncbi:hypothetical protein PFISCL1PPCAC_407 [Pristionchus fissidentatus]|uniref:Uncharacterized protein n=1 Tax=Pristionchus fissidentatus TaxID=1538716 RepID=A0AAV5UPN4_9BILA|nr:hypothetical protein PFISCL1PPCAC_407 [Pristionchus fissidentatus]